MDEHLAIARGAAKALAEIYGRQLELEVEKRIYAPASKQSETFLVTEVVSIATFLLSAVKFAYDVHTNNKSKQSDTEVEIRRIIQLNVNILPHVTDKQRDDIISAILDQVSIKNN